jgi:hypothetical protein
MSASGNAALSEIRAARSMCWIFSNASRRAALSPSHARIGSRFTSSAGDPSCGVPMRSATARGAGIEAGATLKVTLAVNCHNGTPHDDVPYTFTYDPSTNTLTDNFGIVWSRH